MSDTIVVSLLSGALSGAAVALLSAVYLRGVVRRRTVQLETRLRREGGAWLDALVARLKQDGRAIANLKTGQSADADATDRRIVALSNRLTAVEADNERRKAVEMVQAEQRRKDLATIAEMAKLAPGGVIPALTG